MANVVAFFGEAARGDFRTAYFCESIIQLSEIFGEPPTASQGIALAIQALHFQRGLVFFRVHEEGFSVQDYLLGLNFLENKEFIPHLSAICLPGVGNKEIIQATAPVCQTHKSFLILSQKDLYDYLTAS